jgi:hypothetical protein
METDSISPDATTPSGPSSPWKLPILLALLLFGLLVWNQKALNNVRVASQSSPTEWSPSAQPQGELVSLEIDFGNGAKRQFDALPWRAEMTVEDVMQAARDFRPGITYVQIGAAAGGFLTELEGLKNEGASGRNWRYEVAGTPGTMSFCLQKVAPGEQVRWWFAGEAADQ